MKKYRIWSLKDFKKDKIVEDNLTYDKMKLLVLTKYSYGYAWEEITL